MPITTAVNLLKIRRTKIISTIGPACSTPQRIREMIQAGSNIFRLNMSHGQQADHEQTYHNIRRVAAEFDQAIGVLVDLCGPKIRVGMFPNGYISLHNDSEVTITTRAVMGSDSLIHSQYVHLSKDVKPGDPILLNDGNLVLEVKRIVEQTEIICQVKNGGILANHKGINLPGVAVSAPSLTDKDRADVAFALKLGVDFFALSFVRCSADIQCLKDFIAPSKKQMAIIAKIEKPEALNDMDAILDLADGIMIARGDLGVELAIEQVPITQHELIDRARGKFKPVIVATQMLESMINNPRPTRAEVTDVAYAVNLGADSVMLSGETAVGEFPIQAIQMMDRIARHTESYLWEHNAYNRMTNVVNKGARSILFGVANTVVRLAHDLKVHAIVVISQTGMSAATLSSAKPSAPIIAITSRPEVYRKMALLWSVIPELSDTIDNNKLHDLARDVSIKYKLAQSGETILLVRGFHKTAHKNTPSVTVLEIP